MLNFTSVASVTVTVSVAVTPEAITVISALPFLMPTTVPPSTVATDGSLLVQLASPVASEVVPSLLTSVAFTSAVVPAASDSLAGVSSNEAEVAGAPASPVSPPLATGGGKAWSLSSQPTPVTRSNTKSAKIRIHGMLTHSLSSQQFEIEIFIRYVDITRQTCARGTRQ